MSKRVLCKFFANDECQKGDHCRFAHDRNAPAKNICRLYQKGICSYGSRCRYDHVKVSRPQFLAGSSSANSLPSSGSDSAAVTHSSSTTLGVLNSVPIAGSDLSASSTNFSPLEKSSDGIQEPNLDLARKPICSFAAVGQCPHGEDCPDTHGDLCSSCGKHCLHPFRPQEREEHMAVCQKKQRHLDALNHSQDIECNVCLELVLSKPTAAERKFGLLPECDHPFCISCIMNWRSTSPTPGMDVNSTLRACPLCRKVSFFVVPSTIWYSSKEEKMEIINSYKAKLRSIDCKHFSFGNGHCPFGTSCFYKHEVKPGSHPWGRTSELDGSDDGTITAMHLLFDYLYEPDRSIGLPEFGYYDSESEDYDDYTDIGAEMLRQLMEDSDEDDDDDDDDDDDGDSVGAHIANCYLAREMQLFLDMLSSDRD